MSFLNVHAWHGHGACAVDAGDDAGFLLEGGDGFLELPIEHDPIGDDDPRRPLPPKTG